MSLIRKVLTSDDKIHIDSSGLEIRPTVNFSKINLSEFSSLVIPGGNPDSIIFDKKIHHLIYSCEKNDMVLGGICAGVLVLASAGVLKGKIITHNYTLKYAPADLVEITKEFWQGSTYKESSVQLNGNIITAMPEAYIEFGLTLAEKLEYIDVTQRENL